MQYFLSILLLKFIIKRERKRGNILLVVPAVAMETSAFQASKRLLMTSNIWHLLCKLFYDLYRLVFLSIEPQSISTSYLSSVQLATYLRMARFNSVFVLGIILSSAFRTAASVGYEYLGCYNDGDGLIGTNNFDGIRLFPAFFDGNYDLTTDSCAAMCVGYQYFGTQYGYQ
jgi:hypothetical protein